MGERDEHQPCGWRHDEVRAAHRRFVWAGEPDDRESEKCDHRAEPANRRRDVCRERELAESAGHHQDKNSELEASGLTDRGSSLLIL